MTTRDKSILGALAVLGLLAAFWFVGLGPKRDELKELNTKMEESEQAVTSARQEAEQFAKDRLDFPSAYTTMVRLGKAVPADADVPSLVVQLEHAAAQADVNFRSLKLESGSSGASGGAAAAPPAAPPAPAPNGGSASGAAPQGATGSSGAQSTPSSPGGSEGQQTPGQTGSGGGSSSGPADSTPSSSTPSASSAPADATAAATLPIGTEVGPAQLPMFKLNLVFVGNFFKMADLIHNVRRLVKRQDRQLLVSGRLLTLDGVGFEEGDSFPQVKVTMLTTAYLVPLTQGLLAGATPQAPPGASEGTPAPVSTPGGSAPPAAVVTRP